MQLDRATAAETAHITKVMSKAEAIDFARNHDVAVLEGRARVEKFHAGDDTTRATPFEVIESEPNLFLTAGITALWNLVAGSGTAYNATNARLAVGSGTTAAAAGQTALVTETGRQIVDSAPVVSGNTITFVATFGTGSANTSWGECGVVNAASGGTFLNRLVQAFGTKSSAASWVLTLALSIS